MLPFARFIAALAVVVVAATAVFATACSDDGEDQPAPTPSPTATPTATASGTPTPTATPGAAPTRSPTATPTPSLTATPTPSPSVELTDRPMSAEDEGAVDAAVESFIGESFGPAVHVGIWDPAKGFLEKAYGDAVRGSTPATVDDTFRIGSISKSFTATVILLLVDDGKLSLDDTIEDAAPGLAGKYPEVADRTIEQLLGMTSGITDYLNVPDGLVKQISENPDTERSADDLIEAGIAGGIEPAGTEGYSTTNYILLQEIAEEITGESLPDLIQARIAKPLGLTGTELPATGSEGLPEPFTHGYLNELCVEEFEQAGGTATAGADTTDWNISYGQGGGSMHSNLHELGVFAASSVGSALLSDDLASRRVETTAEIGGGRSYGLGVFRVGDWIGHSGEALGWEALALYNPETKVTMVMAVNSCAGGEINMRTIGNILYPDTGLMDGLF